MSKLQYVPSVSELKQQLLNEVHEAHPKFPLNPLEQAFDLAADAHSHQTRRSGEPYIHHPVAVVRILLEMNVDLPSLIAGLLHDTVEDTLLELEDIKEKFGEEVCFLVDGVTKLSKLSFKSSHRLQAENFRKMILAMGRDIRVILIKLADRTHNMRTLHHMSAAKQLRIAAETEEIYAPLAHRLGINWLKTELQDLSLRYLKPEVYEKLVSLVAQSRSAREDYISQVIQIIEQALHESQFTNFEVTGRPKNFYSIYKKMENYQVSFDEIYDLLAFRIVCDDIRSCYQALGILHSMYKPVPGRFKDYIAMPKANLYQSLHTTVIGPGGHRIEVQIRTHEMHRIAESGIAAHWTYKDDGSVDKTEVERFGWIRKLVEDQESTQDASEALQSLKVDLFEEEVFVFSPRGDVVALPRNATPIDFAFSIHSQVGSHCVGAKVNGKLVPLRHQLKSGDSVEIITSDAQTPRKDWLEFVITGRAKSKIRAHLKKAQREESKELGQKLLDREFKKLKLNYAKLQKEGLFEKHARDFGCANEEDLLIKIGYGKVLGLDIARGFQKILGIEGGDGEIVESPEPSTFVPKKQKQAERRAGGSPVRVEGIDNVLVHFAKCCSPIPGEAIVGFVSRGRGITVHSAHCDLALNLDPDRKFDLEWSNSETKREFKAGVKVRTLDRQGMLADITKVISEQEANISNARVQMNKDKTATIFLEVSLQNLHELQRLLTKIEALNGVLSAERHRF